MASFDDLPTPFRCVATDLKNAEAVVLGRGSLAQAMRATMAIPGVFTPVNFENWLLVDGGALNNIPADVTKKMGAEHGDRRQRRRRFGHRGADAAPRWSRCSAARSTR